jgi:hypothetical protein
MVTVQRVWRSQSLMIFPACAQVILLAMTRMMTSCTFITRSTAALG